LTIAYRAAVPSDFHVVVSMWSRAYKHSDQAGMIWSDDWEKTMHPQIQRQLSRPGVQTLVAYEKSDPDFVYGFITGDVSWHVPIVFFVYVKDAYRSHQYRADGTRRRTRARGGIARGLFAALGVDPRQPFRHPVSTPTSIYLRYKTDKIPFAKLDTNLARYPSYDAPAKFGESTHGTDEA
jgi:hypothetical protein